MMSPVLVTVTFPVLAEPLVEVPEKTKNPKPLMFIAPMLVT